MANNSMIRNIDKVVNKAREKYTDIMQSPHIGIDIKVDGQLTKGQSEDNQRRTTIKEQQTKTMTCMLDVEIHRGSLIEMKLNDKDENYSLKGIVASYPSRTPVDWFFYTLIFNTIVERHRNKIIYKPNGDIDDTIPEIIDKIPAFVQRIGMRERQVDMGIDRDSVNEIITTNDWDIQKGDILHIGKDKYKVTDIKELDKEIFNAYMTYYRE